MRLASDQAISATTAAALQPTRTGNPAISNRPGRAAGLVVVRWCIGASVSVRTSRAEGLSHPSTGGPVHRARAEMTMPRNGILPFADLSVLLGKSNRDKQGDPGTPVPMPA